MCVVGRLVARLLVRVVTAARVLVVLVRVLGKTLADGPHGGRRDERESLSSCAHPVLQGVQLSETQQGTEGAIG